MSWLGDQDLGLVTAGNTSSADHRCLMSNWLVSEESSVERCKLRDEQGARCRKSTLLEGYQETGGDG